MKKSLFLILLFTALTISGFSASAVETSEEVNQELSQEQETETSYNAYRDESGRVQPYLRYKQLRKIYRPINYIPEFNDKYSPGWLALGSFIVPGLGELLTNEWGRGMLKFGLCAALQVVRYISLLGYLDGYGITLSNLGLLAVSLWSVVDTIRIAKVKNQYYRELRDQYGMSLNMYPSLSCIPSGNGFKAAPGLTLALNF